MKEDKPGKKRKRNRNSQHTIETRFQMRGGLSLRKLMEYLPTMVVTNLSVLLLISIDGLVVGNLVGPNALASVNFVSPVAVAIGIITAVVAPGSATCLATCMGGQDAERVRYLKSAVNVTAVVAAIVLSLVQIPVAYWMIQSYHLEPELNQMAWQYAIGIMISTPFGLISTLGVFQLQIMGKMKYLMRLSIMEGLVNAALDVLFVGPMDMGVAGAGYGSAGANVVRCVTTVIILWRTTDIYKTGGAKPRLSDVKEIISCGLPDGANSLMLAVQNYCMVQIVIMAFGSDGGVIRGVCVFCFSLANVLISGLQGSMRPLTGLLCGAKDTGGLQILMRQGMVLVTTFMGFMTALFLLFPAFFYHLHGVADVPEGGDMSLRLYCLFLIAKGMDTLLLLYFVNRKDGKYATTMTILGNSTLPIFSFVLCKLWPGPVIWLAYLFTETIILSCNLIRYRWWGKKDAEEADEKARILHLSVRPEEAEEAAHLIRGIAEEAELPLKTANRIAFCLEEIIGGKAQARELDEARRTIRQRLRKRIIVHQKKIQQFEKKKKQRKQRREQFFCSLEQDYVDAFLDNLGPGEEQLVEKIREQAKESLSEIRSEREHLAERRREAKQEEDFDFERDMKQLHNDILDELEDKVETQLIVRLSPEEGMLVLLDDGTEMALEESEDLQELLDSSMQIVKKLAKSVEYQYILNLNYTTLRF